MTLGLADLPELSDLLLKLGKVRLRIAGRSMVPTLKPGDEIIVEPASNEALLTEDLILFEQEGQLICHRVVEVLEDPCTLIARGDAASHSGQRIGRDQVLGKVVSIRKRTLWVGLKETLQAISVSPILRWLPRLQRLEAYRLLLRPIVVPLLSYHLGLAQGARWYDWQEIGADKELPVLPRSRRPHLLMATRREEIVGWSLMSFEDSGWRWEDVYIRIRYRGLGLESDLGRLAHLLVSAQ